MFIALDHLTHEIGAGILEEWDASMFHAPQKPVAVPATKSGDGGDSGGDAAGAEGQSGHTENDLWAGDVEDGSKMDMEQPAIDSDDLIFHTVNHLREQRRYMVQGEPQYHFLYEVLRKLWEEKYGSRASDTTADASFNATPMAVSDHRPSKKNSEGLLPPNIICSGQPAVCKPPASTKAKVRTPETCIALYMGFQG